MKFLKRIADPLEPLPVIHKGGALDWYPWQGGYEAMLFLCPMTSRLGFDAAMIELTACLRPVIRLVE